MSDELPPSSGNPPVGGRHAPSWRAKNQRSSVTLRQEGGDDAGSLMDPATQSLSDALRITYKFVLLAVAALLAFYLFSGARRVQEGERGIRLLFGKVTASDVQPGIRFSVPEPFGELVKVKTGAVAMSIDDDFFPQLTDEEKRQFQTQGAQSLAGGGYAKLNPETDGSVITGDGNLAHTRWALTYRRDDPTRVEENIDPEFERAIVLAACKRGIVRAVASVTIDELLKNTADEARTGEWRAVETRAREVAQKTLDDMNSGIQIDILSMTARIPPRRVMPAFNQVQSSFSESKKLIDDANTYRNQQLLSMAGDAAVPLLEQIREYERAIELGEVAEAETVLARIESLLQGQPTNRDGQAVTFNVYGRVKLLLSEADRDRRSMLANLAGEVERFNAKLATYRSNPLVLINSEWADAYSSVMARKNLNAMFMPNLNSDGRYVLSINPDPQIVKDQQTEVARQKGLEAQRARERMAEAARFETKVEPTQPRAGD